MCVFVDIQDSMNMNVKVGACGNDGGDDEDDDEEGEAADMEGIFPKWSLKSSIWLMYEPDTNNYTSLFRVRRERVIRKRWGKMDLTCE